MLLPTLFVIALCGWLYANRGRYRIRLSPHLIDRMVPNALLTPDKNRRPVFFVGFYKTGTKYYSQVFEQLGYRVLHDCHWRTGSIRVIEQYDMFSDACLHDYESMYAAYPKAKFVLNTRSLRSWLISRMIWIDRIYRGMSQLERRIANPICRILWGNDCYYTDQLVVRWIEERIRYHEGLLRFFADKPESLLVVDIADPDKLDKLSSFLGIPMGAQVTDLGARNVSSVADRQRYAPTVDAALAACGIQDPHRLI